jgi:acetoin utilization deacetylase AcuC-like enzyme
MSKYARLRQLVVESGLFAAEDLLVPHAATDAEILRAHGGEYLRRVQNGGLSDSPSTLPALTRSPGTGSDD